jgi:hypothetical protein
MGFSLTSQTPVSCRRPSVSMYSRSGTEFLLTNFQGRQAHAGPLKSTIGRGAVQVEGYWPFKQRVGKDSLVTGAGLDLRCHRYETIADT